MRRLLATNSAENNEAETEWETIDLDDVSRSSGPWIFRIRARFFGPFSRYF